MPLAPSITQRLDLIVCPACRGPLALAAKDSAIACTACGRTYSIKDGIPVLIPEPAQS